MTESPRDRILARIRAAQDGVSGRVAPEVAEARVMAPRSHIIPARAAVPPGQLGELFEQWARAADATTERVGQWRGVPAALARFASDNEIPVRVRVAPDAALRALPWAEGTALDVGYGRAEPDDRVSLVRAFAGIAETGTVMLISGPDSPTTLNFLPETHVVALQISCIVGSYEDAWARLRDHAGGAGWPRTVNLITGPSRTADIGHTLYKGAHGPRRLHILLIEED